MNRTAGIILLYVLVFAGCSNIGKWNYVKLTDISVQQGIPEAARCLDCHEKEYAAWNSTDHADSAAMDKVSVVQFQQCGACHDNLSAHVEAPENNKPSNIAAMSKSEQNQLCGKCHFNKELLGQEAINPHLHHGLITSVGFDEKKKQQLSCLDCHQGHGDKKNMLQSVQAHTCFKCHKSAIITMGIFQPFNYLAAGKICTACHAPHGTSKTGHAGRMTLGIAATCLPCHIP